MINVSKLLKTTAILAFLTRIGAGGVWAQTSELNYATGKVTGNSHTGGLAGSGSGTVTGSYWDSQTSAQTGSAGGIGRNSDPMTYPYASDTYSGWDFTSTWIADVTPFQNGGYPLLSPAEVFHVTLQVYPPVAGTVSGEGYYLSGQRALLKASANQPFVFKGWSKLWEIISIQQPYSLEVTSNISLVARFDSKSTAVQPPLTAVGARFKLYPNPAKNLLWIDFYSSQSEIITITVADMNGQTIKAIDPGKEFLGKVSIDLTGFKPGIYITRAYCRDGYFSERFVKY
jgi:hypothetical protein